MLVVRGTRVLGLPGLVAGARRRPRRRDAAGDERRAERRGLDVGQALGGRAGGAPRAGRDRGAQPLAPRRGRVRGDVAGHPRRDAGRRRSRGADRAAAARRGHRALPAGRRGRAGGPAGRGSAFRAASSPSTRAASCAGRGSRRSSRRSRGGARGPRTCASSLVGSGEGQALSVEDELRRRAAEADLAGRVDLRRAASSAWRTGCARRTSSSSPRSSRRSGSRSSRRRRAAFRAVACRTGGIVDVVEDGRVRAARRPGRPGAPSSPGLRALGRRTRTGGPRWDGRRGAAPSRASTSATASTAIEPSSGRSLPADFFIPAGTCSSCRWSSSSITGFSSLNEK